MELVTIPLAQLKPHPMNSNVMPAELLAKLAAHLKRTDRYPPVIVRRVEANGPWDHTDDADQSRSPGSHLPGGADLSVKGEVGEATFQILDGHHRVLALKQIGAATARCVVWQVDDAEALTLLATLNRLQGQDDPKKRAKLLAAVESRRGVDVEALAALLPERVEQVRGLLALNDPPVLRAPTPVDDLPVSVHFFLSRAQRGRLEAALRDIGGAREAALMALVDRAS